MPKALEESGKETFTKEDLIPSYGVFAAKKKEGEQKAKEDAGLFIKPQIS